MTRPSILCEKVSYHSCSSIILLLSIDCKSQQCIVLHSFSQSVRYTYGKTATQHYALENINNNDNDYNKKGNII